MKKKQDPKIFFIIFFAVLIILIIPRGTDHYNYTANETDEKLQPDSQTDYVEIARSNSEILNDMLNGASITKGPIEVGEDDISKMPAIYEGLEGELHLIEISVRNGKKIVIMNDTEVLKVIPVMSMTMG